MEERKKKTDDGETAVSTPTKKPYQKPEIIYEGHVTTRAGSPLGNEEEPFDMLDYFLQRPKK